MIVLRVTLAGNRHPLARPEFDLGRVAPDTRMERMTLVLLPDETQRQAMEGPPVGTLPAWAAILARRA